MTTAMYAPSDHSGNPAFSDRVTSEYMTAPAERGTTMTRGGVAIKTLVNLAVLIAAGAWGWSSATDPVAADAGAGYANVTVTIPGGFWLASFGAFFVGILCAFNPRRAAFFGILYAMLEGYVLGAISAMFEAQTEASSAPRSSAPSASSSSPGSCTPWASSNRRASWRSASRPQWAG